MVLKGLVTATVGCSEETGKFSTKVKLWFIIEESFCKEDTIYICCHANRKATPYKSRPEVD